MYRAALQLHTALIDGNLKEIAVQLAKHQTLLASTVVFPLPQFPGRTQENILQQMLRTKLEPSVSDWIERGQNIAPTASKSTPEGLSNADLDELWEGVPQLGQDLLKRQKFGFDYTIAEKEMGVENVKTGLKRELIVPPEDEEEEVDEYDEEEGEEDDEEEEAVDEDRKGDEMDVIEVRRKSSGAPRLEYSVSTKFDKKHMPIEDIFNFMMAGSSDFTARREAALRASGGK